MIDTNTSAPETLIAKWEPPTYYPGETTYIVTVKETISGEQVGDDISVEGK